MADFFEFEADFVDSLRCIPMQVRCKLDQSGIKLKLSDWNQMTPDEREALVQMDCATETEITAYRKFLQKIVFQHSGKPASELQIESHPAWIDKSNIPDTVQNKAQDYGVTLTTQEWAILSDLQRFALIKLSRSGHENQNFPKAMAEFNLI